MNDVILRAAEPSQRRCFRQPIEEILIASRTLDAAVTAHLAGDRSLASDLFARENVPSIRDWTESVWGKKSPYVTVAKLPAPVAPAKVPARMPTTEQKRELHKRDGYHCRYCELPVIRPEVRKRIALAYPESVPWGSTNGSQHAAFQAMWLQYDHVVPHSHGGTNDLDNLVITCAACNFGKMAYTVEELGLADPRTFAPVSSTWDGLERFK